MLERAEIERGIPPTWDKDRLIKETYVVSACTEKKVACIVDTKLPDLDRRVGRLERNKRLSGAIVTEPTVSRPQNGPVKKVKIKRRGLTGYVYVDLSIIIVALIALIGAAWTGG